MLWTISNILSIFRAILVVPISFALLYNNQIAIVIICIIAVITDVLDGYFARKFNQETESGLILDPLADKIFIGAMVFILTFLGKVPLWFLGTVLLRDILIFSGGMYVKKRNGYILPSNYPGKFTVVCISITLLGFALEWSKFTFYLQWIALGAMVLSLLIYTQRFISVLHSKS